jgi:hypothetical protein
MNAIEIWSNHLSQFSENKFSILDKPKVSSKNELIEKLKSGSVSPQLFFECVSRTQSVMEQMFITSILKFSSQRCEEKTKKLFLKTLKDLGIE